MKNDDLIKIIRQIKKYGLSKIFDDEKKLKSWLSKLNNNRINNFLSLNINPSEIKFILNIVINDNLLNCSDYSKRIQALSKIKNGDGCWHLFNELCKPNFVKSKNFYKDLDMLSKADTAKYALLILGKDSFIKSPYHNEDLKLIVETHDTNEENQLDYVVSDALATVAGNIDSINSPYHQEDMKLIAQSGKDYLQMSHSCPDLAINKVSLSDKYHLENMQILAKNPVASEFLYIIMTNSNIINGKNYRKEVVALVNAKSKITARAIYYYIVNPPKKFGSDYSLYNDYTFDLGDAHIVNDNCIAGNKNPDYLENLCTINKISDKFIMYYVSILMNSNLINSPNLKGDLEVLKSISNRSIFMDLYRYITDETSLKNPFHNSDIELLSKTISAKIRQLLLKKMTDEYSIKNINRDFDLKFIFSLDLNNIDKKIFEAMHYYLFAHKGVNDKNHIYILKKLNEGIIIEKRNQILNYLYTLRQQLSDNSDDVKPLINSIPNKKKAKILSLFEKYGKRY